MSHEQMYVYFTKLMKFWETNQNVDRMTVWIHSSMTMCRPMMRNQRKNSLQCLARSLTEILGIHTFQILQGAGCIYSNNVLPISRQSQISYYLGEGDTK